MSQFLEESNFMGLEGYKWWIGVVEDRRDPMKLGRVRVRILAWHTEDKQQIPTCELHWAYFQQSPNSAAMNGIGQSPNGPVEGTWCQGYFRDSDSAQEPVIVGTLGGVPQKPAQPSVGFNDPSKPMHEIDGNAPRKYYYRYYPNDGSGAVLKLETQAKLYPRQAHPWGCVVGEPDTNRLARGEKLDDTIIGVKRRQRDVGDSDPNKATGIHIPFIHTDPQRQWYEPASPAAPVYPYNHVYESESGHIVEFDDTPNNSRFHLYHNSGTFIEIYGNPEHEGDTVIKIVGKHWQVVMEQSYQHFQNNCNVTVDGELNIYCKSNTNIQVDGDCRLDVGGNLTEKVKGDHIVDIQGNETIHIGGSQEIHVSGSQELLVGGNAVYNSSGSMDIAAGGHLNESAGGPFHMASGVSLTGDAPVIHWNSGYGGPQPPISPGPPDVPDFPSPSGMVETLNITDVGPKPEEKPDPQQLTFDQPDDLN